MSRAAQSRINYLYQGPATSPSIFSLMLGHSSTDLHMRPLESSNRTKSRDRHRGLVTQKVKIKTDRSRPGLRLATVDPGGLFHGTGTCRDKSARTLTMLFCFGMSGYMGWIGSLWGLSGGLARDVDGLIGKKAVHEIFDINLAWM